jgi:hypothetical protein
MTSEVHAEADGSSQRQPGLIEVAFWAAGIVCVAFTTCYAYHIGF